MSGDEKAQQIGRVITEYQSAKVELAHLDQKIKTVCEAYTLVARSLTRQTGPSKEYRVDGDKLRLLYVSDMKESVPSSLLNESELVSLIKEREVANARLVDIREQMKALGVGDLQ